MQGMGPPFQLIVLGFAGRCAEGTDQKNRVRNKLKRLIAKRPTLQSLQERGLFRGKVGWAHWDAALRTGFTGVFILCRFWFLDFIIVETGFQYLYQALLKS